jgi:hypothetical protein
LKPNPEREVSKMRVLLTAILMGALLAGGDVISRDYLDSGRVNIRSKTGQLKGWMKRDNISPNRINIYDKNGRMKGFIQRDNLQPNKWRFQKQ